MSLPPFDYDSHTKFTEPPNPPRTFAQKIENTESGLKCAIVSRPIAFASSVSTTGVENLAPFRNGLGFTVNIIASHFVENANTISGLTKAPSIHVKAPRVKESAFSMECEYIHVRNDMLNERGVVDITKYKPIARLGDISYGRVVDVFRLARPVRDRKKERIESVL
ncbi:hypothetical protein EDD15DRAFT_2387023 [Pisolithus albus]|nr:hypothetical protein EDD15DRAFT_2387023 [Pisolithus albus]